MLAALEIPGLGKIEGKTNSYGGWASDSSESPVEHGGFSIPLLIGQPSQVVQDFAEGNSRLRKVLYFQRIWSAPGGIPVSARSRGRHHQHLLLGVRA